MSAVDQGLAAAFALLMCASAGAAGDTASRDAAFREIYKELVEINTTNLVGDTVIAAQAMAARLRAGGLPGADIQVFSFRPAQRQFGRAAARHGFAQTDPPYCAYRCRVEAKREDWAFDPFKLHEVDGFFRGRGTVDDKAMAAAFVANLIEFVERVQARARHHRRAYGR